MVWFSYNSFAWTSFISALDIENPKLLYATAALAEVIKQIQKKNSNFTRYTIAGGFYFPVFEINSVLFFKVCSNNKLTAAVSQQYMYVDLKVTYDMFVAMQMLWMAWIINRNT